MRPAPNFTSSRAVDPGRPGAGLRGPGDLDRIYTFPGGGFEAFGKHKERSSSSETELEKLKKPYISITEESRKGR